MTGKSIPVSLVLWLVAGMFVTVVASVVVSVGQARRAVSVAIERERAASEVGRKALCLVVIMQADVYREATTPVGKSAAEAWDSLGAVFRCER